MRVVPLITASIFGVALSLMLGAYNGDWSTAKSNLASLDAGLWTACADFHSPWTTSPAGSFGRVKAMPTQCFRINRQSAASMGMSNKLFGLLKATRAMAAITITCTGLGLGVTALFTLLGAYPKGLVVVPLIMGILSLLFTILAVSFWGGVHANSFASDHSDYTHAKLGSGWVMMLLGGILSFLTLPSNIVDLALKDTVRYGGVKAAPAMFSAVMSTFGGKGAGGASNGGSGEPTSAH